MLWCPGGHVQWPLKLALFPPQVGGGLALQGSRVGAGGANLSPHSRLGVTSLGGLGVQAVLGLTGVGVTEPWGVGCQHLESVGHCPEGVRSAASGWQDLGEVGGGRWALAAGVCLFPVSTGAGLRLVRAQGSKF